MFLDIIIYLMLSHEPKPTPRILVQVPIVEVIS